MAKKLLKDMTNDELVTWANELRDGASQAGRQGDDSKAKELRAEERNVVRELERRGVLKDLDLPPLE